MQRAKIEAQKLETLQKQIEDRATTKANIIEKFKGFFEPGAQPDDFSMVSVPGVVTIYRGNFAELEISSDITP